MICDRRLTGNDIRLTFGLSTRRKDAPKKSKCNSGLGAILCEAIKPAPIALRAFEH
jgi:hypothetical protein